MQISKISPTFDTAQGAVDDGRVPTLSVVIPTRRFTEGLRGRIGETLQAVPAKEIVVVEPDDLASTAGETTASADMRRGDSACEIRRMSAPRGRGPQCNAGAAAASGDLLLFLHDDTRLPREAWPLIRETFGDPGVGGATFRLRFDKAHPLLRLYGYFSRFESVLTTFGDQGIVIRRRLLEKLGGFPDWPLFEDVELTRRLRRHSRLKKLPAAVTTSAARFEHNGMLRQQLLNSWLMLRFLAGTPAERLALRYERGRN